MKSNRNIIFHYCKSNCSDFISMTLLHPRYKQMFATHIKQFSKIGQSLYSVLPKVLHDIILFDPIRDIYRIRENIKRLEESLFSCLYSFEIWKGQLDLLWKLYQWKQQRTSSDPVIITISTWFIADDSGFSSMLRMIAGNNTLIQ